MDMKKPTILSIAAAALIAVAVLPQASLAAAKAETEETLVIKKKAEAAKKAEARRLAEKKKKEAAAARKKAEEQRRMASRRDCGSFLQCLFGKKRNPNVRSSSLAPSGVSDYETAEVISWDGAGRYAPGSIVVRTPERALYLVLGDGKARRYKVGVGREGFQWSGNSRIVSKQEWPAWRPPQVMIEREAAKGHYIPEYMEGGPENPLGARAMYIGGTMFRIHGTNNAASIGGAVSSGCIRMMNSDVIDLYDRVRVGARVYVYQ